MDVPVDGISYTTEGWGVFMFYSDKKEDKGRARGSGNEMLMIFGNRRARRGLLHEGCACEGQQREGDLHGPPDLQERRLSYSQGKQRTTRKELRGAAGVFLEYARLVAFIAGTMRERGR